VGEGQRGRGLSLQDDQGDEIADVLDQLHAGGWNVGDTAFFDVEDGGQVWVVTGSNGENMIRAEGATCAEAWRHTLNRASAVGRLPGWPRPAPAALPIQAKRSGMPTFFPVITATDGPFGHGPAISATG
jgi:hypothetical protein